MTSEVRRPWALKLLQPALAGGVFVGGLMTWHHDRELYGTEPAGELIGCAESETVSCDIVNTSAYSELAGIPIATLAMPTYLWLALLGLAALRGRPGALFLLQVAGVGATIYSALLLYVSLSELHYLCAWCMRLYVLNLAIPILALIASSKVPAPRPALRDAGLAVAALALLGLLAIGGERAYRASLLGSSEETVLAAHEDDAVGESRGPQRDPEGPAPTSETSITTEDGVPGVLAVRADDAWLGNRDATVRVVEFADLECGYCRRASAQLERLYAAYGGRVLFVFKHYPMDPACNPGVQNRRHAHACEAARAAVCMQRQGLFWEFQRTAFRNQHTLSSESLRHYASHVGGDARELERCMSDPISLDAVRTDAADGAALHIHGTPRIFVQGQLYRSGSSAEAMARAIEIALGSSAAEAQTAAHDLAESTAPIAPIPSEASPTRVIAHGDLRFRMQTFEASIDQHGAASSGVHRIPATHVSWYAARDACAAAGMRLCSEREWITACQGAAAADDDGDGEHADDMVEGTSYPYGDNHEPGRCWDGREGVGFRPVYTAEMPGCVSRDGVYDLTGNVEEWVGRTEDEAVLVGGSFDTPADHARCYRRNDTFGPGLANRRTGFRCCAP